MKTSALVACGVLGVAALPSAADREDLGSEELERYFKNRVAALENPVAEIETAEQWSEKEPVLRSQLREMLGLEPMPERTPLQATVTGTVEHDEFTVENLHFQSLPGLYVTANLYLPKEREGKVPAVLYVCGHGPSKKGEVSFGNKVTYQHHGIWFARNGYACLVIDTIQLGEIEGIHHGLYRYDRWWWLSRGYTPAGVEAWNCVRALDYLQSREEVDGDRLGVTGRSGGGAYSWWIAAIDERIKAAVPVAGIASLRNHVVDGCVEGHCDCMYHFNTYRWDFEQVSALVAPRALLISNTDKDPIFPLDGVYHVYRGTEHIYGLLDAQAQLGLNIEEGPHKDTQPLRVSAFHWMNRFLKGADRSDTFELAAVKMLEPEELKVFSELPDDEINTTIDEVFVAKAGPPETPKTAQEWDALREGWMSTLRDQSFRGWPAELEPRLTAQTTNSIGPEVRSRDFTYEPEPDVRCCLTVLDTPGTQWDELRKVELRVIGPEPRDDWEQDSGLRDDPTEAVIYLHARGLGLVSWKGEVALDPRKQVQIRRRFALIGQTLDGMRTWDILQGIRLLQELLPSGAEMTVEAAGPMAGNALYASLFLEDPVEGLVLHDLPSTHREGPYYLNILKFMNVPQALAMGADRGQVVLAGESDDWEFPQAVGKAVGWPAERLSFKSENAAPAEDN